MVIFELMKENLFKNYLILFVCYCVCYHFYESNSTINIFGCHPVVFRVGIYLSLPGETKR